MITLPAVSSSDPSPMVKFLVDNLELYERLHFHELETREQISSRLQVSLGLVATLAGALSFLVGGVDRNGTGVGFIVFWILLSVSGLSLLYAAYQLKLVFWGNTYKEMPSGQAVKKHEVDLFSHYFEDPLPSEVASASDREKAAKEFCAADFKDFIIEKYTNCATHNAQINMDRADQLHEANRGILVCAGLAFIAFIVFTFGDLQDHGPERVQLSAPAEVNLLSVPSNCLTCEHAPEETPPNMKEGAPSERKESSTTTPAQDSAEAASGAADQGRGDPAAPIVTTSAKEIVK